MVGRVERLENELRRERQTNELLMAAVDRLIEEMIEIRDGNHNEELMASPVPNTVAAAKVRTVSKDGFTSPVVKESRTVAEAADGSVESMFQEE